MRHGQLGRRLRAGYVSDALKPGGTAHQAGIFAARYEHRVVDAGHNLPREAPAAFADAVLTMRQWLHADSAADLCPAGTSSAVPAGMAAPGGAASAASAPSALLTQ